MRTTGHFHARQSFFGVLMVFVLSVAVNPSTAPGTGWQEDFSGGMANWWSEGGERVWVEAGRLNLWADAPKPAGGGVATAWCQRALPANFLVEVEAHIVSSSAGDNNINLFFCYDDPSGRPLQETSEQRTTAEYQLYHQLNGYIVTFLQKSGEARVRIRRNPGFALLAEHRGGECRQNVTYRLTLRKQSGQICFSVNGRVLARAADPTPWSGGILGLRTFRTRLWWDNLRVTPL